MRAACLAALCDRLRAEGPAYSELGSCEGLARCGEDAVLGLLDEVLGGGQQPEVLEIQSGGGGSGGGGGGGGGRRLGFTWAVHRFSERAGEVASPWVPLGGLDWRVTLYPHGHNTGAGTHMAGAVGGTQLPLRAAGGRDEGLGAEALQGPHCA